MRKKTAEPAEIVAALDRDFVPRAPRPPYSDQDPEAVRYRKAVKEVQRTIEVLAEMLVMQLQEAPSIPQKKLDYSQKSLQLLDHHLSSIDYPNAFKKDHLQRWFIPALGGYLTLTVLRHIPKLQWKYGRRLQAHALQPFYDGRLFYPFELAKDAVYSGYRLGDFFQVVAFYANR